MQLQKIIIRYRFFVDNVRLRCTLIHNLIFVFSCAWCFFCVFSLHLMFGKHVHPRVFSLYWNLFLFSFYIKLGLFSCNLINPASSAVSPITQHRRRLLSNPWLLQSSHWQSELLTRLHLIPIRLHFIYCTSRLQPSQPGYTIHLVHIYRLHLIPNQDELIRN